MKRIKLDNTTILFLFLLCLCGQFKQVLLLGVIFFFHEVGHLFYLYLFRVSIVSLTIYPFGGLIKTNKFINFSPLKELIISSAGCFNQVLLYILFFFLIKNNYINLYTYSLFLRLNTSILLFNLLPIIPLDGYIIFSSFFNLFLPYLRVNFLGIFISCISLFLFIFYSYHNKINNIMVISFLLYKFFVYLKERKYIENKFLVERLIYDLPYRVIQYNGDYSSNLLRLNTYHYFNYVSEKSILKSKFNSNYLDYRNKFEK